MSPRLLLPFILVLPACVGLPIGAQGPGGAPPMAMTTGPTAAGLPRPVPGQPLSPADCAQYRAVATQAGMMTAQLDAGLRAQGC